MKAQLSIICGVRLGMMMSLKLRSSKPGRIFGTIIAIMTFSLFGCQHASTNSAEKPLHAWRILERVGDVRSSKMLDPETASLRPGETILGDHLVTTKQGALLILAGQGIQLTISENTSVRLSAPSATDLFLNHGRLRVRIAKAANRDTRIQTAHFDLNASSTSLMLQASPDSTNLAQATLVAGAAAKIDRAFSDDPLIRPASGQAFAKIASLSTAIPKVDDYQPRQTSKGQELPSTRQRPHPVDPNLATTMAPVENLVIRPASRIKRNESSRPETSESNERVAFQSDSTAPQLSRTHPIAAPESSFANEDTRPASRIEEPNNIQLADPPLGNAGMVDTLQLQFDLLTGGLVDQL